jgi:hypothetical protein
MPSYKSSRDVINAEKAQSIAMMCLGIFILQDTTDMFWYVIDGQLKYNRIVTDCEKISILKKRKQMSVCRERE